MLTVAALLFGCQFMAGKVPYFDSVWDVLHTVVRRYLPAYLAAPPPWPGLVVKEYPEAGHGFLNDHQSAGDPIPFMIELTGPILRYAPHDASAQDARRRITEFFAAHLS